MVKSFSILILNQAKSGKIRELKKVSGRQGFVVSEEFANDGSKVVKSLKFLLTTRKSIETIKRTDVELFVRLLLKAKGVIYEQDYLLEVEE